MRRTERDILLGGIVLAIFATSAAGALSASPKSSTNTLAANSARSGNCSKAEAIAVVKRLGWSDASATYPVYKALCGAFTGAGSQTMVASILGPENVGMIYWAVFRWSGTDWQLLVKQHRAAILTAAGSDIRETVSIYRAGDPRCCPSGGTKARNWHWNGARFTASTWTQVTAGKATSSAGTTTSGYFKTPSGNILCGHGLGGGHATVDCVIKSGLKPPLPPSSPGCYPSIVISLNETGRAHAGASQCGRDAPETPYVGADVAKVLGYGKTWSGGGIRCTSAISGLTCRNKGRHGFFLSREKWRAF